MRNSNTIINYGPALPPIGSVPDGSVFYVTQGSTTGFHIHRFISDVNVGAAGDQVGFQWQSASAAGVDALTLGGYPPAYFEPQSANLDSLSSQSKLGFVVRSGVGTYDNRALLGGNGVVISTVGSTTSDLDVTLSVVESELAINSISGVLSVAKGGTGLSSVSPGGIAYGVSTPSIATTSAGVATSGSGTNQNWQLLASAGTGAPIWINATALNVAHSTSAASTTFATTAGTANAVSWANVTSKPTSIADFGVTDVSTTTQMDAADYLNFSPFAGTMRDNKVPVYADFPFSQGYWNTPSFAWVDNENKQVIFYNTTTPTGDALYYRAYRYSDVDSWTYDNLPVAVAFATVLEKVYFISNMGTNFAVVSLGTRTFPLTNTRTVIVKTNGSSSSADWVYAYDVSIIAGTRVGSNFGLVPTNSGDRILNTWISTSGGSYRIVLDVYDSTLTLLRSLTLYDSLTMADVTDSTAAGRVVNSAHNAITLNNYSGRNQTYGFTWNPFNETFHQHFNSYLTYHTPAGAQVGQSFGLDVSFSIPRSWIESGAGVVTNNIPIKSGTYRYRLLSDSTWGTIDGGMSSAFIGAANASLVTDEYSGDMWMTYKTSFSSNYAANNIYRFKANSGFVYQSIDNTAPFAGRYTAGGAVTIPDGSPWSKSIFSYFGHVIGDNILMYVNSVRYGTAVVQTTFDTSSFSSVQAGAVNDTLKLNSANAIINPGSVVGTTWPAAVTANFKSGNMGTVVVGGTPTYYFANGGGLVYTITSSGTQRIFASTGITMPVIPATIDALSGVVDQDCVAWNGDTNAPIWWAVVRDSTGMAYMAKNVSGTWSIVSANIFQVPIDLGKSNRGDAINNIVFPSYSGHPLLTGNGRFLFNFTVAHTGGSAFYWGCFDTTTNVDTYGSLTQFSQLTSGGGKYAPASGYPGATFGYSTTLGYYRFQATPAYDAAFFCSSRDIRGVGADITEDQWFTNSAARYEVWISTESATGLVAYLSAFPIFIGGYFSTLTSQAVVLQPNTDNYIYATRNSADRSIIDVSVSTLQLPSSFSRVLLAKISTDATRIVGQENYAIAQHDSVEELSNVVVANKLVGDTLVWSGSEWNNVHATSASDITAAITANQGSYQADYAKRVPVQLVTVTNTYVHAADAGKLLLISSPLDIRVHDDGSEPTQIPVGSVFTVVFSSASSLTAQLIFDSPIEVTLAGTGLLVGGPTLQFTAGACITLLKIGTDSWLVTGAGLV